jgi:hypothetical protein
MTDFEKQVLADLAVLKAEMHSLVGNGQPGRLRELELRVERHEALIQRGAGIGALIAFLLTIFHMAIDLFKRH